MNEVSFALSEENELGSVTTQLKLKSPDGKKRLSNVLDYNGIIALGKQFPSKKANRFIEWFTYSDETIDGKSKHKASFQTYTVHVFIANLLY
jgi:cell filamentation protein